MAYILSFNVELSTVSAVLMDVSENGARVVDKSFYTHRVMFGDSGEVEENIEGCWKNVVSASRDILDRQKIDKYNIVAITFSCCANTVCLTNASGDLVRRPMSSLDTRGLREFKTVNKKGNMPPYSVKDGLYKYLWIKENDPDAYSRVDKWLDMNGYLVQKCTGQAFATRDIAETYGLYSEKNDGWDISLCKKFGVNPDHLPQLVLSTQMAGALKEEAAEELGLTTGIAVFVGGTNATCVPIGANAYEEGKVSVYWGDSGVVSMAQSKKKPLPMSKMNSIYGAEDKRYNVIGRVAVAESCVSFLNSVFSGFTIDEVDRLLKKKQSNQTSVLFAPWLCGVDSPIEDSCAKGIFAGVTPRTSKEDMEIAVIEGICYQFAWVIEKFNMNKRNPLKMIVFSGVGSEYSAVCQMLADITGLVVKVPQNGAYSGAIGAALVAATGLRLVGSIEDGAFTVGVEDSFAPLNHAIYEEKFNKFKRLYEANKNLF